MPGTQVGGPWSAGTGLVVARWGIGSLVAGDGGTVARGSRYEGMDGSVSTRTRMNDGVDERLDGENGQAGRVTR